MIVLRNKRILYLHGKDEEVKYRPGNNVIYDTLKKHFDIDFFDYHSDPEKGKKEFGRLKVGKYSMVIGFSLGGVYAATIREDIPVILINPGFGVSLKMPGMEEVERMREGNTRPGIRVFQGTADKFFDILYPREVGMYGKSRVNLMPRVEHVPGEKDIEKFIIPVIKNILGGDTVRVWHTTLVSNLDSIKRYGLLSRYQKDRNFENKSLGLGLMKTPCIYLSKNLEHLCIPAVENKKVVLQIDIPKELYNKWNRSNKGDPMYQYFMSNRNKFRTWKDFIDYMIKEMTRQDPNLKASIEKEISVYGSLENTPRYKHGLNSFDALRPENCLISYDDIKPEWISDEVLTESQLSKMGIYFGR